VPGAPASAPPLESVVDRLEDAVALFAPDGRLVFANAAMHGELAGLPGGSSQSLATLWPHGHPYRDIVDETLRTSAPQGPLRVPVPGRPEGEDRGGTSVMADAAPGPSGS